VYTVTQCNKHESTSELTATKHLDILTGIPVGPTGPGFPGLPGTPGEPTGQ